MNKKKEILTWIEVNKDALVQNLSNLRKLVNKNTIIAPCVKSNAYGHGIVGVAKIIEKNGADWISVANIDEGIILRKSGIKIPVQVTSYILNDSLQDAQKNNLIITLSNFEQLYYIKKNNLKLKAFIKVETGMNRTGVNIEDLDKFVNETRKIPQLNILGFTTHFATADELNNDLYLSQRKIFEEVYKKYKNDFNFFQCSNSSDIVRGVPKFCNVVRPGISLYGYLPSTEIENECKKIGLQFKSALSLKTKIIQVKNLRKNETLGYGATFNAQKSIKVATPPIGYFDGIDRGLGNNGEILINGKTCKFIGRVCMNHCFVDITEIPSLKLEDEVTIIPNSISVIENWATKLNTINYEILARLNPLIKRIYV